MLLRLFSATAVLFGFAISTFAQANVVDLIPENALGAIAIRNVKALQEKGDRLIDDQKLKLPTRPSELFKQLVRLLSLDESALDFNGPALVLIANLKESKGDVDLSLVTVVVTIKDEETACASLGLKKGSHGAEQPYVPAGSRTAREAALSGIDTRCRGKCSEEQARSRCS
jgi:hypothetical protein